MDVFSIELRIEGLKHGGQGIIDGEVALGALGFDDEANDDHVADAQVVEVLGVAVGQELGIAAGDAVALVLTAELAQPGPCFGLHPGPGFAVGWQGEFQRLLGQGGSEGKTAGGDGEGLGLVERQHHGVPLGFELERAGAGLLAALVGGQGGERPRIGEGVAPFAHTVAGLQQGEGVGIGFCGGAHVGMGDQAQSGVDPGAHPGDVAALGVAVAHESFHFAFRRAGEEHGERKVQVADLGKAVAMEEELVLIRGLGLAALGEGVEGESGISEGARIAFIIELAQFLAHVIQQLVDDLLRYGNTCIAGLEEGEAAIGGAPHAGLVAAGPVAEAAAVGDHGEEFVDAHLQGLFGFRGVEFLREQVIETAQGKPGHHGGGGLLNAPIRIVQDIAEGITDLAQF